MSTRQTFTKPLLSQPIRASAPAMSRHAIIDRSHMGRNFTGIERITEELFRKGTLGEIDIGYIETGDNRLLKLFTQMFVIPAISLKDRKSVIVFPGFPPSPFIVNPDRCIMYIHDLFLIERPNDLNATAKIYMSPLFKLSLLRMRNFFVNSETTKKNLEKYCRNDARITLYRPSVRNVFNLNPVDRRNIASSRKRINVISIGTVEPRKNYIFATNACSELAKLMNVEVIFHIIGRKGWGEDYGILTGHNNVILHGHVTDSEVEQLVAEADIYLCTARDEGLGLPLLEIQYSGIPVAAPDKPIFREVLDKSGLFFNPDHWASAAKAMADLLLSGDQTTAHSYLSLSNVRRWNDAASRDKAAAIEMIGSIP